MDRFDLEERITVNYNFVQHLKDLAEVVIEKDMEPDDIAKALLGLSVMLDIHTKKLFDDFVEIFDLDK